MRAVLATVIGPAGERDLSLPAELPTAELLPTLIRLLGGRDPHPGDPPSQAGQAGSPDPQATGWMLLTAAGTPIPPWASLAERGVLHGEFLYLAAESPLPPQLRHLRP